MSGRYESTPLPEVETFHVMKQDHNRYRFRISGEDYSHSYLNSLPGFKVKYSVNMTEEDKAIVEDRWKHKIIKEISNAN